MRIAGSAHPGAPRDRATGRRLVDVRPPGRRRRPVEAVEAPLDQLDRCEHASSSRSRISAPCGLDADNAVLDDMRRWILGDLAAEARCAPEAKATTLKEHTGSVADHVNNWGAVRDTLRGTRYEKYLPQPIDPIIDPSNPRLPL